MSADHWMRFNVGDYLADTMHLSTVQHGIYVLLIMHYFKRGNLPEDDASLARISHMAVSRFRRQAEPVLSLFRRDNGAYKHRRIDAERARTATTHARVSPTPERPASSRAHGPEPKLKLVKGRAFARPPTHGGFSHNIAARRAAGDD